MTMISPLDSICRKVTAEIILSVSGEISLRDGTNPTFLHLEIHTTTSQTIYIFINLHIFHWFRTCEGEGGSRDPFNQKILNARNCFRGALKTHFRKKLGIWPNQRPPPLPVSWAAKKRRKKV